MRQKTAQWIKLRCGMAVMTTKTFWVASKACKGHAAMTAFTGSLPLVRQNPRHPRNPFHPRSERRYTYSLRTEVFFPQPVNRHTNREEEVVV